MFAARHLCGPGPASVWECGLRCDASGFLTMTRAVWTSVQPITGTELPDDWYSDWHEPAGCHASPEIRSRSALLSSC